MVTLTPQYPHTHTYTPHPHISTTPTFTQVTFAALHIFDVVFNVLCADVKEMMKTSTRQDSARGTCDVSTIRGCHGDNIYSSYCVFSVQHFDVLGQDLSFFLWSPQQTIVFWCCFCTLCPVHGIMYSVLMVSFTFYQPCIF